MSLASDMLTHRASNNFTQQELADRIGVSREIIMRVEAGKKIRQVNMRKIECYIQFQHQ